MIALTNEQQRDHKADYKYIDGEMFQACGGLYK